MLYLVDSDRFVVY